MPFLFYFKNLKHLNILYVILSIIVYLIIFLNLSHLFVYLRQTANIDRTRCDKHLKTNKYYGNTFCRIVENKDG